TQAGQNLCGKRVFQNRQRHSDALSPLKIALLVTFYSPARGAVACGGSIGQPCAVISAAIAAMIAVVTCSRVASGGNVSGFPNTILSGARRMDFRFVGHISYVPGHATATTGTPLFCTSSAIPGS